MIVKCLPRNIQRFAVKADLSLIRAVFSLLDYIFQSFVFSYFRRLAAKKRKLPPRIRSAHSIHFLVCQFKIKYENIFKNVIELFEPSIAICPTCKCHLRIICAAVYICCLISAGGKDCCRRKTCYDRGNFFQLYKNPFSFYLILIKQTLPGVKQAALFYVRTNGPDIV